MECNLQIKGMRSVHGKEWLKRCSKGTVVREAGKADTIRLDRRGQWRRERHRLYVEVVV